MKLIYADTYSIGAFHEMFNATSLKMFSFIFNEVYYFSTLSSKNNVEALLGVFPSNIKYKRIFNFETRYFYTLIRTGISSLLNISILLRARKDDIIYYNFNSLWGLPLINLFCKVFKRNVIIECHGELELLFNPKLKPMNFISMGILHRYVARGEEKLADSLYYSVLGNSIINNLRNQLSDKMWSHFISFEHTTLFNEPLLDSKEEGEKINVGIIGTIHPNADYSTKMEFAKALKKYNNIRLYALGRIFVPISLMDENRINIIPESDKKFVSRDILFDYIKKMDVICFLYPAYSYKFTASGSLHDSIGCGKLILSLRNDYFEGVNKIASVCRFYESVDDMVAAIIDKSFINENVPIGEFAKLSPESEAQRFAPTLKSLFPNSFNS